MDELDDFYSEQELRRQKQMRETPLDPRKLLKPPGMLGDDLDHASTSAGPRSANSPGNSPGTGFGAISGYQPAPPPTRPASGGGGLGIAVFVFVVMGFTSCNDSLCGDGGRQAAPQPFACIEKVLK